MPSRRTAWLGERWSGNPVIQPVDPCHAASSIAVIIEGDTVHAWIDHCAYIWYLTAPLEKVFFDAFETGDTSIWNAVVPLTRTSPRVSERADSGGQ